MSPTRRLVPLLLCFGMAIIPLVALGGGSSGPAHVSSAGASALAGRPLADQASGGAGDPSVDLMSASDAIVPAAVVAGAAVAVPADPPARTSTTARVTVRRRVTATARTAVRMTTTTTTAPPRPSQTGPASWYPAPAGTCAHPSLPFGTVVTVTDLANGRSVTCRVEDRGPYQGGRIIDLAEQTFAQLAPSSTGVIDVRITW